MFRRKNYPLHRIPEPFLPIIDETSLLAAYTTDEVYEMMYGRGFDPVNRLSEIGGRFYAVVGRKP